MNNFSFVFFGSSQFSVFVLDALFKSGYIPDALVTFPDKPSGRKLILKPNAVKLWGQEKNIQVLEVTTFKDTSIMESLKNFKADVFVVASFGKILPASVIYLPLHKTLNVHPSLLPKLRGPAPIQEAILSESKTGVTIMRLDEKMDEGPIVTKKEVGFTTWPLPYSEAEKILGIEGGSLLVEILPAWIQGTLKETPQDSTAASYTRKIEKVDADITNNTPEQAYKKILAFEVWPRARIGDLIVTKARLENNNLIIEKVVPPGKQEMSYADYLRGQKG